MFINLNPPTKSGIEYESRSGGVKSLAERFESALSESFEFLNLRRVPAGNLREVRRRLQDTSNVTAHYVDRGQRQLRFRLR
jgi:hypothetical protein